MFTNLVQHAVLRAQTNSLQAWFPDIQLEFGDGDASHLSIRARKFDGYEGYAFLLHCKEYRPPLKMTNTMP